MVVPLNHVSIALAVNNERGTAAYGVLENGSARDLNELRAWTNELVELRAWKIWDKRSFKEKEDDMVRALGASNEERRGDDARMPGDRGERPIEDDESNGDQLEERNAELRRRDGDITRLHVELDERDAVI